MGNMVESVERVRFITQENDRIGKSVTSTGEIEKFSYSSSLSLNLSFVQVVYLSRLVRQAWLIKGRKIWLL